METCALSNLLDILKEQNQMNHSEDETGTAARDASNAINYLRVVTAHDVTAQRMLTNIRQYIIHLEHKMIRR